MSDDLIRRSDAVNELAKFLGVPARAFIHEAEKLLKVVPSAQQWIPVTERLPNREEYIQCNGLFIVSDGDRAYAEYFDIYVKKCFGEPVMHGFRTDRAVTAWMPLPEPWEGEKNGDDNT